MRQLGVLGVLFLTFSFGFPSSSAFDMIGECVGGAMDSASYVAGVAEHPGDQAGKVVGAAQDMARMRDRSQEPQRDYTWADVSTCDGEQGRPMLLVLDRRVYDVTDFADVHPGGPKPLKKYLGRDASAAVRACGLQPAVYNTMLARLRVGQISSSEGAGDCENPNF